MQIQPDLIRDKIKVSETQNENKNKINMLHQNKLREFDSFLNTYGQGKPGTETHTPYKESPLGTNID